MFHWHVPVKLSFVSAKCCLVPITLRKQLQRFLGFFFKLRFLFSTCTPFLLSVSQERPWAGLKHNQVSPQKEFQGWIYKGDAYCKILPLVWGCRSSWAGRCLLFLSTPFQSHVPKMRAVCSTGPFLTMCMELLSSKKPLLWRLCQPQVGYCKTLVCWETPHSCDKTYFLDHLINKREMYLCCCGAGPPPNLRCKHCSHELQWLWVIPAVPATDQHGSATRWLPENMIHQLYYPCSPRILSLFSTMSPHARYQDTHKMLRKTIFTS